MPKHVQVGPGGRVQPPYGPDEPTSAERLESAMDKFAGALVQADLAAGAEGVIGPAAQQGFELVMALAKARAEATPEQLGRLRGYAKNTTGREPIEAHIGAINRIMGWS